MVNDAGETVSLSMSPLVAVTTTSAEGSSLSSTSRVGLKPSLVSTEDFDTIIWTPAADWGIEEKAATSPKQQHDEDSTAADWQYGKKTLEKRNRKPEIA